MIRDLLTLGLALVAALAIGVALVAGSVAFWVAHVESENRKLRRILAMLGAAVGG